MNIKNNVRLDSFAIPISIGTFGESSRELNTQICLDSERAFNEVEVEERTGVGIEQTISGLEKHYDSFKTLADIITEYSRPLIGETGTLNTDINAEFFWANRNTNRSAFHMPHSHQLDGYMWTGVYFPTSGWRDGNPISENQDLNKITKITSKTQPSPGDLTILDPLQFVKTGTATKKTNRYPYWGNPICIPPKEGTIVMFPTYLPHLVTPTEEDNFKRLSIAFYVRVHSGDGGTDKF